MTGCRRRPTGGSAADTTGAAPVAPVRFVADVSVIARWSDAK